MVEPVKNSGVIKATHSDADKHQTDICAASSDYETQSVGVKHDELPTAIITVKGMYYYG
jgi:hypothetical protein